MKTLRFVAVMLTALSMGVALCHLLELPAKIGLDGGTWLMLLQTLYPPAFGPVGGFLEAGALIATAVLAFVVRGRRPAFGWTLVAALCMLAAHAAFWILISPVNATLAPLTPDTLPPDWEQLRERWEYTHAARAIIQIGALAALVLSILAETPTRTLRRDQAD